MELCHRKGILHDIAPGSPSRYLLKEKDIIPGWRAVVTYFSPDSAYVGKIPEDLLIGYTPDEYYDYFSAIYHELLDNLGFTPG